MIDNNLCLIGFAGSKIPTPLESREKSNDKFVTWGDGEYYNRYPSFLLKLANDSPTHSSILEHKANYIIGNGLKLKNGQLLDFNANADDTIQDFLNKVVKDYLIFNSFAVEVQYNVFKQPIAYNHVPIQKIRMNKDKTKFWFSHDWIKGKADYTFERFKKKLSANDSYESRLFYYDGYKASESNVYATPDYNGAIASIMTEIDLKDFMRSNVNHHFSPSTVITFFTGRNISKENRDLNQKNLEGSYTGAKGKKIIVEYANADDKGAEVKQITPSDWDKGFEVTYKRVLDDILFGHSIVSPMLFGVKTEGQLGGATELETAYEITKQNYVRVKRNELKSAFNDLFSGNEYVTGDIEFDDIQLFEASLTEEDEKSILTVNERRALRGYKPITGGDVIEGTQIGAAPIQQPEKMSSDAIVINLTDEDFEKVKHLGIGFEDFEFIEEGEFVTSKEHFAQLDAKFELHDEIAEYLLKNDVSGMTVNEIKAAIRKDLGLSVSNGDLGNIFKNLAESGVINVDIADGKATVTKPEEPARKIETMYSYEVRKGYGEPIIDTTRAFCKKLIQNNRLYTREEIQTMAAIFGYDIFSYGGGYYHNPSTGETTTHCRHQFRQRTVTRKKK